MDNSPDDPKRWFSVRNTNVGDAPGMSVALITGLDTDGMLKIDQPNADSIDPRRLVILDGNGAKAGGTGIATNNWPTWVLADQAGSVPAPGDELGTVSGQWYLALGMSGFAAWDADDGDVISAYVNAGGGGASGDVALYRVDGDFVKDDPLVSTACSGTFSPNCYFPVSKAALTCAGFSFSGSYWWVDWYGQEAVTDLALINGTTPQPIITAGGATLVWGKSAGFNYSPAGSGSKPVLMGEALARFWSGGCQIVDGVPQFTGVQAGS